VGRAAEVPHCLWPVCFREERGMWRFGEVLLLRSWEVLRRRSGLRDGLLSFLNLTLEEGLDLPSLPFRVDLRAYW
jgi:hypothetical protein